MPCGLLPTRYICRPRGEVAILRGAYGDTVAGYTVAVPSGCRAEPARPGDYSVHTLLAISHSLEDVLVRHGLATPFYAGFQRVSSFMPQRDRFARLAAQSGEVFLFAVADVPFPRIPGIHHVALAADAPLAREWFIVVDHELFGAALLTRQLGDAPARVTRRVLEFGRGRLYEGLITFEDRLVAAARRALDGALGRPHIPVQRSPDALLAFESPYTVFGRSLVRYLEHNNQQVLGLYHTLGERTRELERLQGVVRKLVSQRAWDEARTASDSPPDTRSTVEVLPLTVLVTDIEQFSRLGEAVDPAVLLESLNRYLDLLATTVYQYRGDVDKFLGDGMLAFFEDPVAALECALILQQRVALFNTGQVAALRPSLPTRIGLATGISLIGRVGSQDRQEITVMGDAVNLASRLQAKAPPGGIVTDRATYEACGRPAAALGRTARLAGRSGLQTVYEVAPEAVSVCAGQVATIRAARASGGVE